jgi:molybdate transport system ATP-binding protein
MDVPAGTRVALELQDGRIRAIKRLAPADLRLLQRRAGEAAAVRPRRAPPRKRSRAAPLITLSRVNLYVEYRAVLRNLNWQLRRGEHWSVFGANGAGKSSFLKLLYGDLAPGYGGHVMRAGSPPGTPIRQWKRHVGFVSPELQSTYAVDVSILELVASGRHASIGLNDPPSRADMNAARHWLAFFKLSTLSRRRPRELSYGQLRRALIARAMAANPRILLLDEPLTGLDPAQRAAMKRLLEALMSRDVTLIIAVHHPEDLPRGMTCGLHLHKRRAFDVDAYFAT